MNTIFIAERPTQILTALALIEDLGLSGDVQILVADCFADASSVVIRFSEYESRVSFRLVATYGEAIDIAAAELPAHLFIHWDVGFGTQRRLKRLHRQNKGSRISLFEEGVGTYRQDIYPAIKKLIFRLIGLPVNIGGSKYVDDIYVYDKKKYVSSALVRPRFVKQIEPSLASFIEAREAQLISIFSARDLIKSLEESSSSVCTIYLSSWNFKELDLEELFPKNGVRVLKLHPHCQTRVLRDDILVAPRSLPAELLVMIASRIFDVVTVYHSGSSLPLYINFENVALINLKNFKDI